MLKGSALALAGAIGWGAGAAVNGGAVSATASGALTLKGVDWRASRAGAPGGLASHGELLGAGGAALGTFASTRLAVPDSPGSAQAGSELQTFSLADGSIFGIGMPAADDETAAFAIIGGTGNYAGATGTYTAAQRPREHGGNGTANFQFSFTHNTTN
jgi:hypothetical protein